MTRVLPELPDHAAQKIVTPRLELLPLRRAHAAMMYPILADTALHAFIGGEPPASVAALEKRYAFLESRRSPDGAELWLNWTMLDRAHSEAVGYVQATIGATHAAIAWVVGTRWQRRGYASEAAAALVVWLADLGVADVRACVNPRHVASRRVAANAGLVRTDEIIDGEDVWRTRGS